MILSKICSYFSYKDCTFGIEWYKQSSARAIIWDMLKSTNIFCVETSFHGYMHKGSVEQFHPSDLFKLGQSILRAIYLDQVQEDCQLFAFTRQQCVDEIEQQRATDQEAGYDKVCAPRRSAPPRAHASTRTDNRDCLNFPCGCSSILFSLPWLAGGADAS